MNDLVEAKKKLDELSNMMSYCDVRSVDTFGSVMYHLGRAELVNSQLKDSTVDGETHLDRQQKLHDIHAKALTIANDMRVRCWKHE